MEPIYSNKIHKNCYSDIKRNDKTGTNIPSFVSIDMFTMTAISKEINGTVTKSILV